LLTGGDVVFLFVGEGGVALGGLVEEKPEDHPDEPEAAGDDEGDAPVVGDDGPGDEGRGEHGADGGTDVVDAAGEAALFGREPFGSGLHAGGVGGAFGEPEQAAQPGEGLPAIGEAM